MSGQIFISYRREDASHPAGRLYDNLVQIFPKNRIFMDIDNLDPGEDFVEAIERSVGSCDALIAVIGRRWLDASNEEGDRRLDNPDDFVRLEISTALKRGIRVIPVLVDGAVMPRSTQLPTELQPLVRRQAIEVSHSRFGADSERLIDAINRAIEKAATEKQEREKTRLGAEVREREEKQRQDADRAEAQRRENERLLNERREKERLDAERLEAERRRRLESLAQAREERRQLDSELSKDAGEERRDQSVGAASNNERGGYGAAIGLAVRPHEKLRFLQKWSFVPFALLLVAWLFNFDRSGHTGYQGLLLCMTDPSLLSFVTIVGFACPSLVLFLHFLTYSGKATIEAALSLIGLLICSLPILFLTREVGVGCILTWCLLAVGTAMKTVVAVQSRKLKKHNRRGLRPGVEQGD